MAGKKEESLGFGSSRKPQPRFSDKRDPDGPEGKLNSLDFYEPSSAPAPKSASSAPRSGGGSSRPRGTLGSGIPQLEFKEIHGDIGASPYPPSGEIIIQGEIHPPKKHDDRAPDAHDYVVYNRCPVFTTAKRGQAMTHKSRHRIGAKQRRLGAVPDIWSNFYKRGFQTDEQGEDIRFMGVTQDGQHNGKDAMNFPESAGRLAVMVHGAVSMVVDERYLDNPCFGDYLEYIPVDSGFRINGTKNYGLPIIRNVKPHQITSTAGGVGGRVGGGSAIKVCISTFYMILHNYRTMLSSTTPKVTTVFG